MTEKKRGPNEATKIKKVVAGFLEALRKGGPGGDWREYAISEGAAPAIPAYQAYKVGRVAKIPRGDDTIRAVEVELLFCASPMWPLQWREGSVIVVKKDEWKVQATSWVPIPIKERWR